MNNDGHILIVSGDPDYLRYEIECPTQPPTATMPCATYGDPCACNERLSAVADDDDAHEALSDDLYGEPCPTSPNGKHYPFDGEWMQPTNECWPRLMLQMEDEPARLLDITEPGRYTVRWGVGDDSEWLELDRESESVSS